MEESKRAGGSDFYASVYNADRPELFFKSTAHRVKGHGQAVRIREDSSWDVPEPELTLALSTNGRIIGYTVGNDMSSRSIEGENLLYLPQAKTYEGAAGLGPCLYVLDTELPASTKISLKIYRSGGLVFEGETELSAMKRKPAELAGYLFRELSFPQGCYLMTGTGIVPGNDFTLESGDCIEIAIEGLGTLEQVVA
jgi:2-dehydro-3-deoxy-D-arabinonate dehydratase